MSVTVRLLGLSSRSRAERENSAPRNKTGGGIVLPYRGRSFLKPRDKQRLAIDQYLWSDKEHASEEHFSCSHTQPKSCTGSFIVEPN